MKIVKRIEDNVVLFLEDTLNLTGQGTFGTNWKSSVVTNKDHVIEEVVNVPDNFTGGSWTYDKGDWKPWPLYPDLQSARLAMITQINDLTRSITDGYPLSEVASWGVKAGSARAIKSGTAHPDQIAMIQNEANITGRTLDAQADAIIAKAEAFESITSKVSGIRQVTEVALVEASTPTERVAVLRVAMMQIEKIITEFGL